MFSQPTSQEITLLEVPRMAPEMILPALLCKILCVFFFIGAVIKIYVRVLQAGSYK